MFQIDKLTSGSDTKEQEPLLRVEERTLFFSLLLQFVLSNILPISQGQNTKANFLVGAFSVIKDLLQLSKEFLEICCRVVQQRSQQEGGLNIKNFLRDSIVPNVLNVTFLTLYRLPCDITNPVLYELIDLHGASSKLEAAIISSADPKVI